MKNKIEIIGKFCSIAKYSEMTGKSVEFEYTHAEALNNFKEKRNT